MAPNTIKLDGEVGREVPLGPRGRQGLLSGTGGVSGVESLPHGVPLNREKAERDPEMDRGSPGMRGSSLCA